LTRLVSQPRKKERKAERQKPKLSEDAVKTFHRQRLQDKSEFVCPFSGGNVKIVKVLDAMVKAKQLEVTMTKSKKNKDVTNYKVK